MLILLSSASRSRYKEDVLRAISMPAGSYLSFRYDDEWIPAELQREFAFAKTTGEKALACYLHVPNKKGMCISIPCRYATIVRTERVENWFEITIRLDVIPVCDNPEKFTRDISQQFSSYPVKQGLRAVGNFCHRLKDNPIEVPTAYDSKQWAKVIKSLAKYPTFNDLPFFYHVSGIRKTGTEKFIVQKGGQYSLAGAGDYEIEIVHYHPGDARNLVGRSNEHQYLVAKSNSDCVQFTTNSRLLVDSPYDRKVLRLRTSQVRLKQHALVTLQRLVTSPGHAEAEDPVLCEVQIDTTVNLGRAALAIIVFWVMLSCEGLIVVPKGILGVYGATVGFISIVLLALATSVAAYFGLRSKWAE